MAVHVIAGVMGSGKSYEAVKEKILPAVKSGQRVVTNIHGLNHQLIAEHLKLSLADVQARLIVVSDADILVKSSNKDGAPLVLNDAVLPADENDNSTLIQPGDLVVLDEVWQVFPKGVSLSPRIMTFFRMHRHWVSAETNLTTDIVLCIQSIRDLHADIRSVVEVRFQCRKMKIIGRPDKYQVWLYEGDSRTASHHYDRKYEAHIFPLYKSHAKGGAVESFDVRQSGFNRPLFKLVMPLAAVAVVLGTVISVLAYRKMTGTPAAAPATATAPAADSDLKPGSKPIVQNPAPAASAPVGLSSDNWRVVASYKSGGLPVIVVVDDTGRYRSFSPGSVSYGPAGDVYAPVPADSPGVATTFAGKNSTYSSYTSRRN